MTPVEAPAAAPLISVVIPTRSRPAALERCLASLAGQAFPPDAFEVVVVDDGGAPPATPRAGAGPGSLRVVRQPHAGAAAARMAGVAHARDAILAFLDDDCTVPPDYLAAVAAVFRTHPETRVVQVAVLNPEPANPYGRLWSFNLDRLLQANLRPAPDGRRLCATLGGVMVARREVFDRVAFDPRLPVALEDADLRWQLHAGGIDVHYEPGIRVYHHVPATLAGYLAQFGRYGRGAVHLRRKWGSHPPPFRYCSLTGPRDLAALAAAEGLGRGAALYGVLWLRRLALAGGGAYEAARLLARAHAPRGRPGAAARTP